MLALAKSSHYTVEFSPHLRPTTINNRQLFVCSAGDQVDALTKKVRPFGIIEIEEFDSFECFVDTTCVSVCVTLEQ